MLSYALECRHQLSLGTSWVNYVRGHDDIGWSFADEDAAELGINASDHRRFLNSFYVNRLEDSFARGVPFQDSPRTVGWVDRLIPLRPTPSGPTR